MGTELEERKKIQEEERLEQIKREKYREGLKKKERELQKKIREEREILKLKIEEEKIKERMLLEKKEKHRLEELLEEKKRLNNQLLEKTKNPKNDFFKVDKANAFVYGKNPKKLNETDETADSVEIYKDIGKKNRKKHDDEMEKERER